MPKRIQRKRTKGWRMPRGAVYVGRPTTWGNPFTVGCEAWRFSTTIPHPRPGDLDEVLEDYRYLARQWLYFQRDWLDELKGKDLACWCPLDKDCHADILLKMANS